MNMDDSRIIRTEAAGDAWRDESGEKRQHVCVD